uniref:Ig-like domain-containing protein n=1 Tax=Anas platyrhynchos platyrhynchos TaxID=8840 RepID=A0A493T2F3_ANAPP
CQPGWIGVRVGARSTWNKSRWCCGCAKLCLSWEQTGSLPWNSIPPQVKHQPHALPPATGTDPHLSLGGYEAGGVRVLCRSAGWYPLPQLLWRDARGQHLPSVSQTHSQDQEGLFEIEGAVIVTGSVEGPLSCVVRNNHLQQERKFSLHISGTNGTARVRCSWPLHLSEPRRSLDLALPPAGMKIQPFSWCLFSAPFFHNAQPWIVALALVLVLLAVSIGLGVYLFRKQAAQRRELSESLQSLPPAPGEVVSLREGLGLVWVGSGGLCAGGSGVLEEQLEPGVGVRSAGAGAALGMGHGRDG